MHVTVVQDEAEFQILRGPGTGYQPQVTYPNGDTETLSPDELRSLIPAYVYNQGELSEIGRIREGEVSFQDLVAFVQAPFVLEADEISQKIQNAKAALGREMQLLVRKWRLLAEHSRAQTRLKTLEARIEALRKTLPKLDQKDQEILDRHEEFMLRQQECGLLTQQLDRVRNELSALLDRACSVKKISESSRTEFAGRMNGVVDDAVHAAESEGRLWEWKHINAGSSAAELMNSWAEVFRDNKEQTKNVMDKKGVHQSMRRQIADLLQTAATERTKTESLDLELTEIGQLGDGLREARRNLRSTIDEQVVSLKEWARES